MSTANIITACATAAAAASAAIGAVVGDMAAEPVAYETRYQVTIDDSVQFNEFLDKYEIVKQEGKIYIVKEKTNE